MENIELTAVQEILMNLMGGLMPKDLSQTEIDLLIGRYGKDWEFKLGYRQ